MFDSIPKKHYIENFSPFFFLLVRNNSLHNNVTLNFIVIKKTTYILPDIHKIINPNKESERKNQPNKKK